MQSWYCCLLPPFYPYLCACLTIFCTSKNIRVQSTVQFNSTLLFSTVTRNRKQRQMAKTRKLSWERAGKEKKKVKIFFLSNFAFSLLPPYFCVTAKPRYLNFLFFRKCERFLNFLYGIERYVLCASKCVSSINGKALWRPCVRREGGLNHSLWQICFPVVKYLTAFSFPFISPLFPLHWIFSLLFRCSLLASFLTVYYFLTLTC